MKTSVDAGSFRDPSGRVFRVGDRIFRTVMPPAKEDFEYVRSKGLIDRLSEKGLLVPETRVEPGVLGELAQGASYVLEHPCLPFISYPYEWSFSALKAAALLHLDVHILALDNDVTLSDATAYNIQFQGPNPVFIDHLSFRRYREGEFWNAHGQFCEQFLNPLLLRSFCGVPHNAWYRGSQEGIPVSELNRLLPIRSKFYWNIFTHVVLQARLQDAVTNRRHAATASKRKLPKAAFRNMLESFRKWIVGLQPADTGNTVWRDYVNAHGYSDEEVTAKKAFVEAFAADTRSAIVWDIGCNTGDYSKVCLDTGTELVVGFDFDHGALESAFSRAQAQELNFLPLFLDAGNPAPNQGWAERERLGLGARASLDGLLALAVVHHLAISRNIPLDQVVDWLVGIASTGVIEFVPKADPMVQELLRLREDIFTDYTKEIFLKEIQDRARIVRQETVSKSGRLLVWFQHD